MSVTISTLVNTDTFGDWKDKTNDLIDMAGKTLTIGAGETNSGNVEISGNVTVEQTLFVDTIQPYTVGPDTVTIDSELDVTGTVTATTFSGSGASLTNLNGSNIASGTISASYLPNAGAAAAGIVTTGTQTFAGTKTFSSTISGSINGNAATATTATGATNININATTSTDTTTYPVLVGAASSGNQIPFIDNSDLSYNASTGALSATSFVGDGASLTGIITDLSYDTSPQLGGTLESNGNDVQMADNDSVIFGTGGGGSDSQIYWNGSALKVDVNGGNLHIEMDGAGNTDIVTITSGGANTFLFDASAGNLTVSGDITAFGTLSDIAVKENISLIEDPLEKITKISGYTFNYKDTPNTRMTGVIAQEVQKVLPEVVYRQGDKLAVRYNNMVGLLIEAIKELREEVRILKGEIR